MTMNDVGSREFREHRYIVRIETLAAHVPWITKYPHAQRTDTRTVFVVAEAEQGCGYDVSHVARPLERVAFRASGNAVGTEHSRHDMHDARRGGAGVCIVEAGCL